MDHTKESYQKLVKENTPKNKILKNCIYAFLFGGLICVFAELLKNIIMNLNINKDDAGTITSIILVGITAFLTGIGVYDKIGKIAGAGTIVPITGFANSVVAPAMEHKREGVILGTASNIFKLAGPVLLFGYSSSMVVGLISYIIDKI